jgi:hypothetical protein
MEHVPIGEFEVSVDYFKLSDEDKKDLCMGLIECIVGMLDRELPKEFSRFELLNKLLESSRITNLEDENYEIVAILEDCFNLLNETNSK